MPKRSRRVNPSGISKYTVGVTPSEDVHDIETTKEPHIETPVTSELGPRSQYFNLTQTSKLNNKIEDVVFEDINLSGIGVGKIATHKKRFILTPNTTFMRRWDVVCSIGLVYTATSTPFDIAFRSDNNEYDWYFFINRIIDLIFLLDIFINFMLAYRVNDDEGGHFIVNRKQIAAHYLRGWFTLDFISILPFDIVASVLVRGGSAGADLQFLKVMKLFRLAKLARIVRIIRIFRRFEDHLSLSYAFQSIVKFVLTVLVMCHWLACTWRITAEVEESASISWYVVEGYSSLPAHEVYITCLYWATTTVTTIGYGNAANPVTTTEHGVAIFCMCFGAACWAYVIGAISGIVSSLNTHELEYRETMDVLNDFMNYKRLPQDLRVRLRSFFRFRRTMMRDHAYSMLFESMSPALRGEVASHTNREWLAKVPWANETSPAFITSVSMALEPAVFAPKELIEFGNLNIVTRGILARGGQIFTSGGVWGMDVLLTNPVLKHRTPARALTFVQVFQLDRQTLFKIIEKFPLEAARLRQSAIWMALRRGIVVYSKIVRNVLRMCNRLCRVEHENILNALKECDKADDGYISTGDFLEVFEHFGLDIPDAVLPSLQRMTEFGNESDGSFDEDLEPHIDYKSFLKIFDHSLNSFHNLDQVTNEKSHRISLTRKATMNAILGGKGDGTTGVIDAFSTQDENHEITSEKAPVLVKSSTTRSVYGHGDLDKIFTRLDTQEIQLDEILEILKGMKYQEALGRLASSTQNGIVNRAEISGTGFGGAAIESRNSSGGIKTIGGHNRLHSGIMKRNRSSASIRKTNEGISRASLKWQEDVPMDSLIEKQKSTKVIQVVKVKPMSDTNDDNTNSESAQDTNRNHK